MPRRIIPSARIHDCRTRFFSASKGGQSTPSRTYSQKCCSVPAQKSLSTCLCAALVKMYFEMCDTYASTFVMLLHHYLQAAKRMVYLLHGKGSGNEERPPAPCASRMNSTAEAEVPTLKCGKSRGAHFGGKNNKKKSAS